MILYRHRHDERGSIVIALMIIFVATGLIVGTTLLVYNSMKTTRRLGDSANALQLADAAINDAVKDIPTVVGSNLGPVTKSLGTAGSYTYSGTLDNTTNIWHVDAWGTDKGGVRRHLKAEAVPQPLFGNALFVDSALSLPAGVVARQLHLRSVAGQQLHAQRLRRYERPRRPDVQCIRRKRHRTARLHRHRVVRRAERLAIPRGRLCRLPRHRLA